MLRFNLPFSFKRVISHRMVLWTVLVDCDWLAWSWWQCPLEATGWVEYIFDLESGPVDSDQVVDPDFTRNCTVSTRKLNSKWPSQWLTLSILLIHMYFWCPSSQRAQWCHLKTSYSYIIIVSYNKILSYYIITSLPASMNPPVFHG